MSNPQRHQFPTVDKPAKTPEWLERKGPPSEGVTTLLSLLQGDPQPPRPLHEPAPSAAAHPPPPPPPSVPPPPPSPPEASFPPEPDVRSLDLPDELLLNQLPGPPRLGSLLPGGRSNPPPANDRDHGLAEQQQAYANAAIELAIARAATLAVLEGQLLDLAIEVAEAIIEKEVAADPALHSALARAALNLLGDVRHVTLRTSHEGFAAITAAFGGEEIDSHGVRVHIVADPSIPGLGCVVDSDNVRVDATVAERLRAVRSAFEEERRRAMENVE